MRFWPRSEERKIRRSKFIDSRIAFILRQAGEGMPVEDICRRAGISQAIYYIWCLKYGGIMPSEMKRLKQLEVRPMR